MKKSLYYWSVLILSVFISLGCSRDDLGDDKATMQLDIYGSSGEYEMVLNRSYEIIKGDKVVPLPEEDPTEAEYNITMNIDTNASNIILLAGRAKVVHKPLLQQ